MQKAVILNTCVIVRKYLAQQWIRSVWWWDPYSFENQLNCCEVRNVDDGDDDDDDDDDDDSNNTSTGNWTLEQRKGPKESNQTVCARICNKVHEPEATGLSHLPLTKLREGCLAFRATVGVNSVDVWYRWEHLSPGAINELPKYIIPSDGVLDYKRKIASETWSTWRFTLKIESHVKGECILQPFQQYEIKTVSLKASTLKLRLVAEISNITAGQVSQTHDLQACQVGYREAGSSVD